MYCNQKYSGVVKGFLLGAVLVFSVMFLGSNSNKYQSTKNAVSFEESLSRIKSDDIKEVRIKNETAEFFKDGQLAFSTSVDSDFMKEALLGQISSNRISVSFAPESSNPFGYLIQILFWLFFISPPIIVVLLLIIIKKMDANSANR